MAISLSSIQKTKHATPPRLIIHGAEKVGKSTFAAQAPSLFSSVPRMDLTALMLMPFR